MDQLVTKIWDAAMPLYEWTTEQASFVFSVDDLLEKLNEIWDRLRERYSELKSMVELAERRAHIRTIREVYRLFEAIDSMELTINGIRTRSQRILDQRSIFCAMNCCSRYKLGKEVSNTTHEVHFLVSKIEWQFEILHTDADIASELPRPLGVEMPVPETVGMDLMLKKVLDCIGDENIGIIGLYGMGGSGKTTLMKKLSNEFAKTRHNFAPMIWIMVSRDYDVEKIIDDIQENYKIGDVNWKDKSRVEKAREIYNVLKEKKYILFLDDVWEELDLCSIGVPFPNETNQSKILITTRFENVCDQMQAKKFKVGCLTEKEASDLCCMKVGEENINSEPALRMLAKELLQECEGLPLALVTVGRAISGPKSPQAWKHTLKKLKNFPPAVKGMEKEVFFNLMLSYDSLPTTIEKSCFLYFALFPKDKIIYVPDLILLWIGEGLLGEHDSVQDAVNRGEDVVESLKIASLLEDYGDNNVKMHKVIRNMALWLVRDQDQKKDKILVQGEALGSTKESNLEKWKIAERISMISDNHIEKVLTWDVPVSPHGVTLIVWCNARLKDFANVQFMRKLKVLSLRWIEGITKLPIEIGLLVHLEHLDLSYLNIKEKFPIEMKSLTRLRLFLLEHVHFGLEIIPLEVISCLENLRVFLFWGKRFWETMNDLPPLISFPSTYSAEELFLEHLELLPLLEDISITLDTPSGISKLLSSTKLQHCMRNVGIHQQYGLTAIHVPVIPSVVNMEHLEVMHLVGWQYSLEESSISHTDIFSKLSEVQILDCHSITHLTWLKYAPLLRSLKVVKCNLLEEVMKGIEDDNEIENMDGIFENIDSMILRSLPNLRSVHKNTLRFHELVVMEIIQCPNLKKLPLDCNSATKALKRIRGEILWWNNLEWEDPVVKDLFQAKFTGDITGS